MKIALQKLIICSLLCASLTSCMDKQVKPYEPGFSARHPLITRVLKSAGAGIGTSLVAYAGLKYCENPKATSWALLAGYSAAVGTCIYDVHKKPNLLDAMICDPFRAHSYFCGIQRKFIADTAKIGSINPNNAHAAMVQLKSLLANYQAKEPVFLLGECDERMPYQVGLLVYRSSQGCLFDRSEYPSRRAAFENAVAELFCERSEKLNINRPIIYASVGSGGMFQDAVHLTKFLAKKPQAKIEIHLIDPRYEPYAKHLEQENSQREVPLIPLYPEQAMRTVENFFNDDAVNAGQAIIQSHAKHWEFLLWLKINFPHAHIKLFSHESVASYCKTIENEVDKYPDIITAADIQDDSCRRAIPDYITLCAKTLAVKPQSKNILLFKKDGPSAFIEIPALGTISLTQEDSSQEVKVTDLDNNTHTVFFHEHTL